MLTMIIFCSICHRLRNNPVYSTEMVSIRIFDLQKVGQGHELQCRRIRRWMAFCSLQDIYKWRIYINSFSTLIHQRGIHTDTHSDDSNRRSI